MKQEILQTSLEQFLKHGIRKMSVRKLVQPLNISTKTFYKYFENKEDLLNQSLLFYYDQKFESLRVHSHKMKVIPLLCEIWYGTLKMELRINQAFFHDLLYYYPELSENFLIVTENKFLQSFIQIIKRGIAEGVLQQDIYPEVVLDCLFILYTAIARKGHFEGSDIAPLDLLRNSIIVYIRGICTRKGIILLDEHTRNFVPFKTAPLFRKTYP